jgi:hypothetical protein
MTSIERKRRRRKADLLMLCLRRMTSMRKMLERIPTLASSTRIPVSLSASFAFNLILMLLNNLIKI